MHVKHQKCVVAMVKLQSWCENHTLATRPHGLIRTGRQATPVFSFDAVSRLFGPFLRKLHEVFRGFLWKNRFFCFLCVFHCFGPVYGSFRPKQAEIFASPRFFGQQERLIFGQQGKTVFLNSEKTLGNTLTRELDAQQTAVTHLGPGWKGQP